MSAVAVPAAALMLGAAQAGTTIGLNFQAWYYDSGATPQTIGFGAGYQTTGFPVTAKAFGVDVANWVNSEPLSCNVGLPVAAVVPIDGNLKATVNAANMWQSGYTSPGHWGMPAGDWSGAVWPPGAEVMAAMQPGEYEVTWGMVDNTGWTIDLEGLAGKFPNGYVLGLLGAGKTTANSTVGITNRADGVGLAEVKFKVLPDAMGIGASPVLTADSVQLYNDSRPSNRNVALGGLIFTDQPVVVEKPTGGIYNNGGTISLSAAAIGIAPITYQWYTNGVPIPGANTNTYVKAAATSADTADYTLVASNAYGSGTSVVAKVTVLLTPTVINDLPASATNYLGLNQKLTVVAGGLSPLNYQWYKGANAVNGGTDSTLNLSNLQAGDAADYKLVITNSLGRATSSVFTLTLVSSQPPYDGFNYPEGPLTGQEGGIGWEGPWTLESGYNGEHMIIPPTVPWRGGLSELVSSGRVVQTGASGSADFDAVRNLKTTLGGPSSGTLYLSFVGQVTNTGWGGIELVKDGTASLFLGSSWYATSWGWGSRGSASAGSGVSASTFALLVYRFDFTPTNTQVSLYVNPSSLSTEPATASATGSIAALTFNQIRIVTHNDSPNGVFDELRLGGTWQSVTPHVARTDAPFVLAVTPGGLIQDTKPSGTPHNGLNRGTTWVNSFTDASSTPITRTGLAQFTAGAGSQIVVPWNADFDATKGTVCFWMKADAPLPGGGNEGAMLFDRRTSTGAVIVLKNDGTIFWQGQGGARNSFSVGYLPDGNWHHVAVSYSQAIGDTLTIYIDGQPAASNPVTNSWTWPANQQIELGRSHDTYWKRFDGLMDDFRFYSRQLSDAEVTQVYTTSAIVDASTLKVRFDFDSALFGQSLVWPYGTLISSPALGQDANWTPVPGAVSPMPFETTSPALFYRLLGTP